MESNPFYEFNFLYSIFFCAQIKKTTYSLFSPNFFKRLHISVFKKLYLFQILFQIKFIFKLLSHDSAFTSAPGCRWQGKYSVAIFQMRKSVHV